MHDLVVRGGTVAHGTDAPARTADIAVTDGLATGAGRVDGPARPGTGAAGSRDGEHRGARPGPRLGGGG